jgi:hypothetical protein
MKGRDIFIVLVILLLSVFILSFLGVSITGNSSAGPTDDRFDLNFLKFVGLKKDCEEGSCFLKFIRREKNCLNLIDDDSDGLIDCKDEDCFGKLNANGLACCNDDGDSFGGDCPPNSNCDDGSYDESFQCLYCLEGEWDCRDNYICVEGKCFLPEDVPEEEEEFVFTWWAYENRLGYPDGHDWRIDFDVVEDVMDVGFTHVSVRMDQTLDYEEDLDRIREEGYDIALEIAGVGTVPLASPEKDDSKFLDAPCLNKELCDKWDWFRSVDPTYRGEDWDDTLSHWQEIVDVADPDLVYFDLEMWHDPQDYEKNYLSWDLNQDCNCEVVNEGIGYDSYVQSWEENYFTFYNTIKSVKDVDLYFYNNLQEGNCRYTQNNLGEEIYLTSEDMPVRPGNPGLLSLGLYVLPNLEILEKNLEECNFEDGFIPYLSYTYMGYFTTGGDDYEATSLYFDPSISREAGRMLARAGAGGAIIYPSLREIKDFWEGEGYDYWLEHSEQLVLGFKEADTYVETNMIKNYDFEAYMPKTSSPYALEGRYYVPLYWSWEDSNERYVESLEYADLTRDYHSGSYSWKHSRGEGRGERTITSDLVYLEKGEYKFSIWTKSNVISSGSNIKFYLSDEYLGVVDFENSWDDFVTTVDMDEGEYVLTIVIKDNTEDSVDVYLDDISLELV